MSRHAPIDPVFDKARDRWKVEVPASRSETGKRVRVFFRNRKRARDYAATLASPGPAIAPAIAVDADTARQRLEAAGLDMTLAEAVRELVEARELLAGAGTLGEAARDAAARAAARDASKPVGEAVAAFMDTKAETLRETTLASYRYTLERTLEPLHGRTLSDIGPADLEAVLADKKPTACAMHYRNARAFIKWAAAPARRWCAADALEGVEIAKVRADSDIAILRADDVRALLDAAPRVSPSAAVAFAVAVFAGVRMGELAKLLWCDVREQEIEIGPRIAKRHARRLVPISPTLRAWLDAYRPPDVAPDDPITGPNWREVNRAVRRLAGWDVAARILENLPEPTRGKWPANAPRHTHASVQVAVGTSLDDLVFAFGHAAGHDLLRRHYVSRMSRRAALEILRIGPNGSKLETISAA